MENVRTPLPSAFVHRFAREWSAAVSTAVLDAMEGVPTVSVRMNMRKPCTRFADAFPMPWSTSGRVLPSRPVFALDPLYHAGCYYPQDASSMAVEAAVRVALADLDDPLILDACAAPGGKSLSVLDALGETGFLISNEVDAKRHSILWENILKWGRSRVATTSVPMSVLADSSMKFDLILLDAPCSGEGMFRKDQYARKQWSTGLVCQCAHIQSQLLDTALQCLTDGGYLLYSTCALNVLENEDQVMKMMRHGMKVVDIPQLNEGSGVMPARDGLGYYLLPGLVAGEGQYLCLLRNKSERNGKNRFRRSVVQPMRIQKAVSSFLPLCDYSHQWTKGGTVFGVSISESVHFRISTDINFRTIGLPVITQKGKDLIPEHGLAMTPGCPVDESLDLEASLRYLRRETNFSPVRETNGWRTVGFENIALGWIKSVSGRVNNYYPSSLRLRLNSNG